MIIGGSLEKSALENKPIIYIKQNANQENFRWTREESLIMGIVKQEPHAQNYLNWQPF